MYGVILHFILPNQDTIAQYLLFKGARYDIKNDSHKTAFIDACQFKTKKFIQSVLSKENVSFPVDDICRDYPLHYYTMHV